MLKNTRTECYRNIRTAGTLRQRACLLLFAVLLVLCSAGCTGDGNGADPSGRSDTGSTVMTGFAPQVTEHRYPLEGLDREYKLLFVADLHIIAENDPQVNGKDREMVTHRRTQMFATPYGDSAAYWKRLAPSLDAFEADLIVFAGDMVDYASEETLALLAEGFAQIKTPFIYLRADHDTEPFYADGQLTPEAAHNMQDTLADNRAMFVRDLGGLTVLGWNNATSVMTREQLDSLLAFHADHGGDTPLIFVTHVPLASSSDTGLAKASAQIFDGRALLWGSDCYYVPDAVTSQGLSLLFDGPLPVSHVFAGHLHFAYDGPLTDQCSQHVLAPAFGDAVTCVTFSPQP